MKSKLVKFSLYDKYDSENDSDIHYIRNTDIKEAFKYKEKYIDQWYITLILYDNSKVYVTVNSFERALQDGDL